VRISDLFLALLLAVPPWVGFLLYRYKGRTGLSYGYFLGGILAILAIPWSPLGNRNLPSAHLGGALLGFIFFLQAHREGRNGIRRLAVGVGGSTLFAWIVGSLLGLEMQSVAVFWGTALLEGGLWLLLSDLGYRFTRGRWLAIRMPAAGGCAFLVVTAIFHLLTLGPPPLSWAASLLAGILLGLVALHQLVWLRDQGIWVEGRGDGLRTALSALEGDQPPEGPSLAYAIDARQAMILVNDRGMLLETNNAFSRLVGLPRHQMKGYQLQDLFQGAEAPAWEVLRTQLLQEAHGATTATLVRRDSSFFAVQLEAVAFDRDMALVWIADPALGTLALRVEGSTPAAAAEAPALRPAGLQAVPELEAMLPRLRRMLPEGFTAALRLAPATLLVEGEPLARIVTQMVLHGRQCLRKGVITLVLSPVVLGDHAWSRLTLELEGAAQPRAGEFLGLSWLQTSVRECSGILEVDQDDRGFLVPRVLLPCLEDVPSPPGGLLDGRRFWIIHREPGLARTLCDAAAAEGGNAQAFPGLKAMLSAAQRSMPPDALVLERTRTLDRYQARLCRLGGRDLPVLLLDDGRPLPQGASAPRRLVLAAKPFPGPDFIPCLLTLLT